MKTSYCLRVLQAAILVALLSFCSLTVSAASVVFHKVSLTPDCYVNGEQGVKIHIWATVKDNAGKDVAFWAYVDSPKFKGHKNPQGRYKLANDAVAIGRTCKSNGYESKFSDVCIFLPYNDLGLSPGTTTYYIRVFCFADRNFKNHIGVSDFASFTKSGASATVSKTAPKKTTAPKPSSAPRKQTTAASKPMAAQRTLISNVRVDKEKKITNGSNRTFFNIHVDLTAVNLKDKKCRLEVRLKNQEGKWVGMGGRSNTDESLVSYMYKYITPTSSNQRFADIVIGIDEIFVSMVRGHNSYQAFVDLKDAAGNRLASYNSAKFTYHSNSMTSYLPTKPYDWDNPNKYEAKSNGGSPKGKSSASKSGNGRGSGGGTVACNMCNGSGICKSCGGTGNSGIYIRAVGGRMPCAACGGGKKCVYCKGTGRLKQPVRQVVPIEMPTTSTDDGGYEQYLRYPEYQQSSGSRSGSRRSSSTSSSRSVCSSCGGTGVDPTCRDEGRTHSSSLQIWHIYVNSEGNVCPYCRRVTYHHHNRCSRCNAPVR